MERWDAYDRDGRKTGAVLVRGKPVPEGLYHLVSEILVRHRDGDYLLMRRDLRKQGWPGAWEAAAGGSALQGEDPLSCAYRELREETGIAAVELQPIGRCLSKDTIYHQYLCITDCDKRAVVIQPGETMDFRWVSEAEFIRYMLSDQAITPQQNRYRAYFRQMGWMA